jgi:hypothetical protein
VRFPAQEHHVSAPALARSTCDSIPASLDSTTLNPASFKPNCVLVDHGLDHAVAVVARLDAIDLAAQLLLELGEVGKVLQPLL